MPTDTPIAAHALVGQHRLLAYLALAAGVICIAWSAIFVRWTDIPGPASAFYRLLLPALVLLPPLSSIALNLASVAAT